MEDRYPFAKLNLKVKSAKTFMNFTDLQLEIVPPPTAAHCIVSEHVCGPLTDPLRYWPVLKQILDELRLNGEGLSSFATCRKRILILQHSEPS